MSEFNLKLILIILLTICLFNMPYGYYQLVRFCGFIGFGLLAYSAKNDGKLHLMLVYASLSLLFQPFFKLTLGREIWNSVDLLVAVFLVVTIIIKNKA